MKKCNKFQQYFIFANNDDFQKHLEECPDCRAENAEFEKISELVKEVKFVYKQKKRNNLMAKVACLSMLMMFTFSFSFVNSMGNFDYYSYSEETIIDEMGMPVDDYGLFMVD